MGMAPKLGWLHLCLGSSDIEASCSFWENIGFTQVDGQRSEGWAIMHNAETELGIYSGHMEEGSVTLNFRGSDIREWRELIAQNGIPFKEEGFTKEDGSGHFTVLDPAGNPLFFDSSPEERVRFETGKRMAVGEGDGSLLEGQPLIGTVDYCLFVDDVAEMQTFYQRLGMQRCAGELKHNWVCLTDGWHRIALFGREHQGDFPDFLINFRGGDVQAISDRLADAGLEMDLAAMQESDGSMGAVISDPDGFCIYFNTAPDERMY